METVRMRADGDGKLMISSQENFNDFGFQSASDHSYPEEFSDVQNLITDILCSLSTSEEMKMDAQSANQSTECMETGADGDTAKGTSSQDYDSALSDQSSEAASLDLSTSGGASGESDVSTQEHHVEKVDATVAQRLIENNNHSSLTEFLLMAKIRNSLLEVMKWLQLGAANITRYRLAFLRKTIREQRSLLDCLLHKGYVPKPTPRPERANGGTDRRLSARDKEVNSLAEFLESLDKSLKKMRNSDCVRMDERYVLNGNQLQKQSFHLRGVNSPVAVRMLSRQLERPAGGAPEVSPNPPPTDPQPLMDEDAPIPDQAEDVENRSPVRPIPIMVNRPLASGRPLPSTSTPIGGEQQGHLTVLQFPPRSGQGPRRFHLPDYRILTVKKNEIFYPGSVASNLWQSLENRPSAVPRTVLESIDHW